MLERAAEQMGQLASKHGLTYSERMDELQNQKSGLDSHNISETSSAEDIAHARRFLLTRVERILADAKRTEKEHLFGSHPISMVALEDIVSEIDRIRHLHPKFEVGKTGTHILMDDIAMYLAGLEFDKKHHPDEVHVMGTFDSAIDNAEEALTLLNAFQARLMAEKIKVER